MSSSGAGFRSYNKLTRPQEFQKVFSSGKRSADKQFLFIAGDNASGSARLGLAIPKRHVQKAVFRNRIKRVIRESFRLNQKQLKGLDIVVLLRKPLNGLDRKAFDSILNKHWKKNCQ